MRRLKTWLAAATTGGGSEFEKLRSNALCVFTLYSVYSVHL